MFLVDFPGNFHRPGRTCKNIKTGEIFDDFTLLLMYVEGLQCKISGSNNSLS